MVREGWLGQIEILEQDAGTLFALLQKLQDMQPVGIPQSFECPYFLCK